MTAQLDGFRAAGVHCGLKPNDALDLGMIVADEGYPATAVFTRTAFVGAHIPFCRDQLARSGGLVRALLVNSKNANCATGADGIADAALLARAVAEQVDCPPEQVLVMSTGVIGQRLPTDKLLAGIDQAFAGLAPQGLPAFAEAVMTTDTYPKLETEDATGDDGPFRVVGIAKGSGMIHPDMATMLGFLLTDAKSSFDHSMLLRSLCEDSFHAVTVDGDTSPNDSVLLWSAGRIWSREQTDAEGMTAEPLQDALIDVSKRLARHIARDGEGATRLVTIRVTGAASNREAREVGRLIATSPLCKTAVHGRDPNWGRILAAASRHGTPINIDQSTVKIGGALMFAENRPHPENEPAASQHMRDCDEVLIEIDLAYGPFDAECWTCDFSADYVSINADYRT